MDDMRIYLRVPRTYRVAKGYYVSLRLFNRYIDLYNENEQELDFWAFISNKLNYDIRGFDMMRNIGNEAMKYVHIINMKG